MAHFKLEHLSVTELLQNPQQTIPSHPFREGNWEETGRERK